MDKSIGNKAIYDVRKEGLSAGKISILAVQHVFAFFGATVLVPLLQQHQGIAS